MEKNTFGQHVKYGAFKFQNLLTRYFKIVVIVLTIIFICLFFINLVNAYEKSISAGYELSFNGDVIHDTALKLSLLDYFKTFHTLFPQNNSNSINWWKESTSECVGCVILDLFYLIAFVGLIVSIVLSFKKPEKNVTKLLPLISLIIFMLGIAIGISLLSKGYTYDNFNYMTPVPEPDWYFSWAFYLLIIMIVFYATHYGLYLFFRNRPAPEKPAKTPKHAKEKALSDKERIAQLEHEVQELKKQSTDNTPPIDN